MPPRILSDFAKTWSLAFCLDSGAARIQAQLASQKTQGGGGGGGLHHGKYGYQLVGCRGEERVSFNDTFCCTVFEFLVLNNLVIDCVSGYVSALLNLVWGVLH